MIILFALFAPAVSQHNSTEQNVTDRNLPSKIPLLEKLIICLLMAKMLTAKILIKR